MFRKSEKQKREKGIEEFFAAYERLKKTAREATYDELLIFNGGKEVENTNAGVANAQVGDTVTRNDGTEVTLTQGDIDWAQNQVGAESGSTATQTTTSASTPTNTSDAMGNNRTPINGDNRTPSMPNGYNGTSGKDSNTTSETGRDSIYKTTDASNKSDNSIVNSETKNDTGSTQAKNDNDSGKVIPKSNGNFTSDTMHFDDYGRASSDPYVITGKNMGEMIIDEINIVVEYSDEKNENGATIGTMYVYYVDKFRRAKNPAGYLQASYPIVSGSNDFEPAPKGIWKDVKQEKTSTSSSKLLKDSNHGGADNIMIRLWGTGGDAIHQGNNTVTVEDAFTEGCIGVTSYNLDYSSDKYYNHFKGVINPYGETIGVPLNVEIK